MKCGNAIAFCILAIHQCRGRVSLLDSLVPAVQLCWRTFSLWLSCIQSREFAFFSSASAKVFGLKRLRLINCLQWFIALEMIFANRDGSFERLFCRRKWIVCSGWFIAGGRKTRWIYSFELVLFFVSLKDDCEFRNKVTSLSVNRLNLKPLKS